MHFHSFGFSDNFLILGILGLFVLGSYSATMRSRRRKEMEHLERMKALEMGLVPLPSGLDWPAAAVCIAVGAGVPIGSFAIAWFATLTTDVADGIWVAPVFVSFSAIAASRKLACRVIDPKSASRQDAFARQAMPVGKPSYDPDAFDVVGRRG